MTRWEITRAVKRIKRMEKRFDKLCAMAEKNPSHVDKRILRTLTDYYENGQWMYDYELDEMGYLPADLKRGVLSEDGVYNLLTLLSGADRE